MSAADRIGDDAGRFSPPEKRGGYDAAFLDAIASPLLVFDREGRIVRVNRACEELVRRVSGDLVRQPFAMVLRDPRARARLDRWLADPAAHDAPLRLEPDSRAQGTREGPIGWQLVAIADERGVIAEIVATGTDLTAQRAAETATMERERRWRALFDNLLVGVGVCDCDRRLLDGNRALERMVGRTVAELRDQPYPIATHPDDRDRDLASFRAIATGRRERDDRRKRYLHRNGTIVWCRLTLSLLRDPDGAPFRVLKLLVEITEQVRAEQMLQIRALGLTRAELAVLSLLARADLATYAAIGGVLHRSDETIRKHAQHIAAKLKLARVSREAIVAAAEARGLFNLPLDPTSER